MSIFKTASSKIPSAATIDKRLQIKRLIGATRLVNSSAGSDVVQGLTQNPKTLPTHYLYDDRGSELFEQICELPEYYPTRTETAILQTYAHEIAQITGRCELVELGSGSSTKTRILLDAYHQLGYPFQYIPVDISGGILESSARQLLADYPLLQVQGFVSTYELALEQLAPTQSSPRMICFIGSTLGNLAPEVCDMFLCQIRAALHEKEYFLLGVDLQKSKSLLEAAYNDSQEVTAAFNLNILDHLNRRFEGNFDISQFEHWAFYNEAQQQIEIHLRSLCSQEVELRVLDLKVELQQGETIKTEISRKFDLNTLQQQLSHYKLLPIHTWTDQNHWYGLILCQRHS